MQKSHRHVLDSLAAKGRLRRLTGRRGLDFTSNDYLGLAESAGLKQAVAEALARGVPVGAGGSRLLRGNHPEHEMLEEEAAAFFGVEAALYFPTGFAANAAIIATLPRPGDLIVYDALIHASLRSSLDPARHNALATPHNDVAAIEDAIKKWRAGDGTGRVWIVVETLYSMDGDRAPLADLIALAQRHDAMLILDEAHATGVYGPQGRGLAADFEGAPNIISLHTCGKALGVMGALVCMPRLLADFMINRGRSFIYSTAPSPLMAAATRAALKIAAGADAERAELQALVRHAGGLMKDRLGHAASGSQIQPIIVGADKSAVQLAAAMQARGYDIRAIRPPTVPEGTARLRIALTLNTDAKILDRLFADLAAEMEKA
ncbi:MAG TPA: 8-amino-7-oxononanoate synthase [Rhizomicrobium sp.]|nr:8-amino-7-oxononanoate synthase [Rhizomicrobium sp.]